MTPVRYPVLGLHTEAAISIMQHKSAAMQRFTKKKRSNLRAIMAFICFSGYLWIRDAESPSKATNFINSNFSAECIDPFLLYVSRKCLGSFISPVIRNNVGRL
jgi:hypothetical protein